MILVQSLLGDGFTKNGSTAPSACVGLHILNFIVIKKNALFILSLIMRKIFLLFPSFGAYKITPWSDIPPPDVARLEISQKEDSRQINKKKRRRSTLL